MTMVSKESIQNALTKVIDPTSGATLLTVAKVAGLVINEGNVSFSLEVDPIKGHTMEGLRKAAEAAVLLISGVSSVNAVLTAHRSAVRPQQSRIPARQSIPKIKSIIAIASGKGGVGKSTVATNVAVALSNNGLKVGMLDADVYGPSLARMMGIKHKSEIFKGTKMLPLESHNIKCMSMGFLAAEDTPTIWRGPMVMGALEQMLRDVEWGELDLLVVDMPPGTGDAQITMAQRVPMAGAVIVSTPQDIALLDARKGLNMFRRLAVPILGIVENMSYFICPCCGERSDIFGHEGARMEAKKLNVPFLGEVPLHLDIRVASDNGIPIIASEPLSPHGIAFTNIATKLELTISSSC
ncbi:ATPase involved in chromosome partitioning [Candidatus Endolissoclinum faulkneri L2]|uniref:Iron-sulfur cluster carrier protein n=1 Tax=Candidatus Endolissoclinum faulkneri L2 TaxID=1193729 RepID=K7ZCW7_9PROT|nr:Mrp/NBP35 family ATP-binding protein [Candidatus Endolissoclinum faulkneri]AFX98951.1 ATPase involved in chromosome partitioning [Candidatus Endolissoclinum faulkneri L2]